MTSQVTNAIPVEKVSEIFAAWRTANPDEAARIQDKLTNMMIFGNARKATAWYVGAVADRTGLPYTLVAEYVRKHARD